MAIGDENNNYISFDFNTFSKKSSQDQQVPLRPLSENTSQCRPSHSVGSLASLCTNTSCSSISTLNGKDLLDVDDFQFIPVIPSEDEEEDWIQFGYLLEDNDNVLPRFEHLDRRHHHRHYSCNNQYYKEHYFDHRHHIDATKHFHRSFSVPSTPESQISSFHDGLSITTEKSESSLISLRVEPPLTPSPSSPTSCIFTSTASLDEHIDSKPSTYMEKPYTEEEASTTLAFLNIKSQQSNVENYDESEDASSLKRSLLINDCDGETKTEKTEHDEPIAKRTRKQDLNKSMSESDDGNALFSPYRVNARPWWLGKLVSMRRQNDRKQQKRRKPTCKSTNCKIPSSKRSKINQNKG